MDGVGKKMQNEFEDNKRYCLPEDYRPNKVNRTNERVSEDAYWTNERLHAASVWQAAVYAYAGKLLRSDRSLKTVVDVGCGPAVKLSALARAFPGREYFGIDQLSAIEFCQSNYSFGSWLVDDFEHPNFKHGLTNPDLIICSDVIEHLEDPDLLMEYIRRLSGSSSKVVLSTPDRARLSGEESRTPRNPAHIREWTFSEFRCYLEKHNFEVLYCCHNLAIKPSFNRVFIRHALKRFNRFEGLRYNQMWLGRVR